MIFTENLIKSLKRNNINFFSGVPDSILKNTKWKPEIKIEQGLDMTINWLKEFGDLYKHNIYHV